MKLTFENVSKTYGKTRALSDFSAELTPGIYALLGPNGAGKSTLMNIITDNVRASSGCIRYNGEDICKMGEGFRAKLGFMPQYPGMYGNFTAETFLWYMSALKGMQTRDAEKSIPAVLEAVELTEYANRRISAFSGGMKQRLALAQAVLGDPEILILDEPTAGLDPKQRIAVRNFISRIAFNKIVIIATHIVSDIEFIARDVILLKKGVIADHAQPSQLLKKIEGKVWRVGVSEADVTAMQQAFRVTGILKEDTGVSLRILADAPPPENAVPVKPTLEDYYLHVFGESPSER